MLKYVLIYLWLYIELFYVIEAGEDDEHVHIKLHMPSGGRRKLAQLRQQHTHHKKRHTPLTSHLHHKQHHHTPHSHSLTGPPPIVTVAEAVPVTNLYNDSPYKYLTGITSTSSSVPVQHVHTQAHIKNLPLHFYESDHPLTMEQEEVYTNGYGIDGDANSEEPIIPAYVATNFASFPQPTTTYETEIIPHNSKRFNAVDHGHVAMFGPGHNNEVTAPTAFTANNLESTLMLNEQLDNLQRHKAEETKSMTNEQLLQQLLQQHSNKREIINAPGKHRGHKYKNEKDYYSEDDMTKAMMYLSSRQLPNTDHSNTPKPLTVNDIWSQLQRQYLNKYTPQAQPLTIDNDEEQLQPPITTAKSKPTRKRNIKRHKLPKPTTNTNSEFYSSPSSTSSSSFSMWPTNTLKLRSNNHYKQQKRQRQQPYYDNIHSSLSPVSSQQNADLFVNRPSHNNFHNEADAELSEDNDDDSTDDENNTDTEKDVIDDIYGDDNDVNHYDESFEEAVYQSGKKFTEHPTYGHHHSNLFNYHDLYGSYSTPITATVATKLQPSTYHPNFSASTISSYTSPIPRTTSSTTSAGNSFLSTIHQPPTSHQWRTQQNYPTSFQTYQMQHQWPATRAIVDGRQPHYSKSSALRTSTATITQTPNTIMPIHTNDFTSPSLSPASSSSVKSTVQTPGAVSHYKKRKNHRTVII